MTIGLNFFIVYKCSCYLALGDLEDASRSYMCCLNNNTSSSDPKIFTEASDGLEKVKVSWTFLLRQNKYIWCSLFLFFAFHIFLTNWIDILFILESIDYLFFLVRKTYYLFACSQLFTIFEIVMPNRTPYVLPPAANNFIRALPRSPIWHFRYW